MVKKRNRISAAAEKVGRGNPPKHTQFRKGTTGNPNGRPKGSKNLSTYIMEAARDHVTATVGGRKRWSQLSEQNLRVDKWSVCLG
jgi:hypothetical protein